MPSVCGFDLRLGIDDDGDQGILVVNILQNAITEEGRATVMSFDSIGQTIAMIGFSLIYAWLAGIFTLQQGYIIISVYGIVGG